MEFNYNVPQAGYGGFSIDFTADVSLYNALTFYVKGTKGNETFKVGLKDSLNQEIKVLVTDYLPNGVTTSFQKVTLPLSAFYGLKLDSLSNFSITVEDPLTPSSSALYIDEIEVTNVE